MKQGECVAEVCLERFNDSSDLAKGGLPPSRAAFFAARSFALRRSVCSLLTFPLSLFRDICRVRFLRESSMIFESRTSGACANTANHSAALAQPTYLPTAYSTGLLKKASGVSCR